MTDWSVFKALAAEERDRLGFAHWQWQTRQGTHGSGCHEWGPAHHSCALKEIERLQAELAQAEFENSDLREYAPDAGETE